MTAAPRYSVLIPAFNHAKFVEEAVTSALDDGGNQVDVIIVDDGSTDKTPDVLAHLASDSRVTVHRQDNQGAHAALNRLLTLGRGEFFFILNSDDAFENGRLKHLADMLDQNPQATLACSYLKIVDANGQEIGIKHAWRDLEPWPTPLPPPHLADFNDPILALLQTNWAATTSNFVFRRRTVIEHNLSFSNLRYTHDWNFILNASRFGEIIVVEDPSMRYRVHANNTIKEGGTDAQAVMRFEVLWTVACHAAPTLTRAVQRGFDPDQLKDCLMRSLPTFGREDLLYQLLALRGITDTPPPSYDALLRPEHPLRRAMVLALG